MFCVRVPVLSEQITSVPPKVSTAGNLRTKARRSAIFCVPNARIIVEIAGKPSGRAATAIEMAVNSIVIQSNPRNKPRTKITMAMITIA